MIDDEERPEKPLPKPHSPLNPITGKWKWGINNELEFESFLTYEKANIKKRGVGEGINKGLKGNSTFARNLEKSKAKNKKSAPDDEEEEEKRVIKIQDIKEIAISMLTKVEDEIPKGFERIFESQQLDDLLFSLMKYFHWVFEKYNIDNKPNLNNIEPSLRELEEYEQILENIKAHESVVGPAYSALILGLDLKSEHHMRCGETPVSSTLSDRELFEMVYKLCIYVIWITFKRKDFHLVEKNIGRLLRSDTFNPAIRIKHYNPQIDKSGKKTEEVKISPAEYRRRKQKRPAVTSIITQRSPVIVSILPNPKEKSPWLFEKKCEQKIPKMKDKFIHDEVRADTLKVGILGDLMNQYTAQLTPKDDAENEDEEAGDIENELPNVHNETELEED